MASFSSVVYCLRVRTGAYLTAEHTKSVLPEYALALFSNISFGWKSFLGTNTLAYYGSLPYRPGWKALLGRNALAYLATTSVMKKKEVLQHLHQIYRFHKSVGHLRNADEEKDENDGVQNAATRSFPDLNVSVHSPHGQQNAFAAVNVRIWVGVIVGAVSDGVFVGAVSDGVIVGCFRRRKCQTK
jgi:hypothetical protein